jgi:hypothetical protein
MADEPGPRQPYHAAEGLEVQEAERLLKRFAAAAQGKARRALARVVRDLRALGHEPRTAGILQAAGRPPKDLGAILSSHALIHAADGEHFRDVLAHAGERVGLPVTRVVERELVGRAGIALRKRPADLQREVASWGRPLGPPWTADQKLAALLAWMLLANPSS